MPADRAFHSISVWNKKLLISMRAVNRKTAKNGRSLGAYGETGGFCRQRPDTFAAIQNPWRPCFGKRSHPAMLYPQRDSTVQPLPGRRSRSDLMIAGKMKGGQRPPFGSTQKTLWSQSLSRFCFRLHFEWSSLFLSLRHFLSLSCPSCPSSRSSSSPLDR